MNPKTNSIFLVSLVIGAISFSIGGLSSSSVTSMSWFFLPMIVSFAAIFVAIDLERLSQAKLEETQNIRDALVIAEMFNSQAESLESRHKKSEVNENFTND